MTLDDEALKLVSESEGFRQINAAASARVAEVVLAVASTDSGRPYDDVDAAARARFAAAGVPIPMHDYDKIVRTISDARRPA